ncbi:MAG: bifunctional riboflavin kinase/FAD synthetase [Pseudomonadota bacterium]
MGTQILNDISEFASVAGKDSALTIGNFDGVHPGHEHLLHRLVKTAESRGLVSVVLTFEPHPLVFLSRGQAVKRLTSRDYKVKLLKETGLDFIIVQPFDADFAAISPEEFIERVMVRTLRAKALIIGPDFRFGHKRAGDRKLLETHARRHGIEIISIESLRENGRPVSSSYIRELLENEGRVTDVLRILGRPYGFEGTVVKGAGRGRELGFPTANLAGIDVLVPKEGIYAALSYIKGKAFPAAVHIGERKTFEGPFSVEAYILSGGEDLSLYDQNIRLFFLKRLRDVIKFSGKEELIKKINEDIDDTRKIYGKLIDTIETSRLEY